MAQLIVSLSLLTAALQADSSLKVDPFYLQALREGTDAYNRSVYVQAVEHLRLANFGLLEEPKLLARGLCLLALSQARLDNRDTFRESFLRLVELEARFHAYSEAALDPMVRADFETEVARLIPRTTLQSSEGFSQLADRALDESLAKLPERQRKQELERVIAQYPDEPRWSLMLAMLKLRDGESDGAIALCSAVLVAQPTNPEALKVRGLAYTDEKQWNLAVRDLAASGSVAQEATVAEALLRGYIELRRWKEASAFLEALSQEIRGQRSISQLAERIP